MSTKKENILLSRHKIKRLKDRTDCSDKRQKIIFINDSLQLQMSASIAIYIQFLIEKNQCISIKKGRKIKKSSTSTNVKINAISKTSIFIVCLYLSRVWFTALLNYRLSHAVPPRGANIATLCQTFFTTTKYHQYKSLNSAICLCNICTYK